MLRKLYDQKYMSIAIHATLGIAAVTLLVAFGFHFGEIRGAAADAFSVLRPIAFALVLSYFCNPLMNLGERYVFSWLDRFPRFPKIFRRVFSLLLAYLLILLVLAGIILLVVPEIVNNYESLIGNLTDFVLTAVDWVDNVLHLVNADSVADIVVRNSDRLLATVADLVTKVLTTLANTVLSVILAVVLSFFMLLYKEVWTTRLRRTAVSVLPRKFYAELCDTLVFANRTFGRYLVGSVFDSLLVGCEVFLLLLIFGVPYRGLVSVLVGVTNIIPYFGPFIGTIPAFVIILTQDPFKAFLFVGIVLVVQQIDGNFINPRIIGKTTNINSMWVIIAITVIGGWLGILGMLIAIPLFSVIYMLMRRFVNRRLRKKGLPTSREAYAHAFSVSHYRVHGGHGMPPPTERPEGTAAGETETKNEEDEA